LATNFSGIRLVGPCDYVELRGAETVELDAALRACLESRVFLQPRRRFHPSCIGISRWHLLVYLDIRIGEDNLVIEKREISLLKVADQKKNKIAFAGLGSVSEDLRRRHVGLVERQDVSAWAAS
jgi:hypothetical protein